MPDPALLTIDYDAILDRVGTYIGYKADPDDWTARQLAKVLSYVKSGFSTFYNPPPVREGDESYQWNFLRPLIDITTTAPYETGTVTVVNGVVTLAGGTFPSWAASGQIELDGVLYEVDSRDTGTQLTLENTTVDADAGSEYRLGRQSYDLSSNFGGFIGKMTYPRGSGYGPVEYVGSQLMRVRQQGVDFMGRPLRYATQVATHDPTVGTRWQVLFDPMPDAEYVLSARIRLIPSMIDSTNKYPLGGDIHGETIIESCLAAAERGKNDEQGVHHAAFMRCLAASISLDKDAYSPDTLGVLGEELSQEFGARDYRMGSPVSSIQFLGWD